MNIIDKLYKLNNKTIPKSVNIDDSLYDQIKILTEKTYDAKLSEIINVAVEEYIDRNEPNYYSKPKGETVTYRNLMLRKNNVKKLKEYHDKTGISFTRLLNGAIKEFLDNH
jgi:metal-responsive CopG/Arc/MetJ family transcriptional regulator